MEREKENDRDREMREGMERGGQRWSICTREKEQKDYQPIINRLKNMVIPLDCSSSWALTPVCTGRMGLGVGAAGVVALVTGIVEWRVPLLELSVSFGLLKGDAVDFGDSSTDRKLHY